MAETISDGTTTLEVDLVLGATTTQAGRSILHDVIGRQDPDVTLRAAATRAGTLKLFFLEESDAEACRIMHAGASVFTYASDAVPSASMNYVVDEDGIEKAIDEDQLLRWTVNVGFREVSE